MAEKKAQRENSRKNLPQTVVGLEAEKQDISGAGGQNLRGTKRHPTLEDNVTVYSGASILGGETVIGEGAIIGSNAFITSSVPGGTRVSIKNPELQFKGRVRMTELGQEGFWKG